MPDDRGGPRRIFSTIPGETETETAQRDASVDEPFADFERVEDTVPYLPPLSSYRVQIRITEVSRGEPHIYPDELLEEDDSGESE